MVFITAVTRNTIKTPTQLYKHLLRTCQKLPKDAALFYKHSIRQVPLTSLAVSSKQPDRGKELLFQALKFMFLQSFRQHEFEPDPERVKQIIDKSVQDAEWILQKVRFIELKNQFL